MMASSITAQQQSNNFDALQGEILGGHHFLEGKRIFYRILTFIGGESYKLRE